MTTAFVESKEFKCPNGLAKFSGHYKTDSIDKVCSKCTDGTDLGCIGLNIDNNFSFDPLHEMTYTNLEWDKVNELVRFMDKGSPIDKLYGGKTMLELQTEGKCENGYYGFKADKYTYLPTGEIIISNFSPLCAETLYNGMNGDIPVPIVPDKLPAMSYPHSTGTVSVISTENVAVVDSTVSNVTGNTNSTVSDVNSTVAPVTPIISDVILEVTSPEVVSKSVETDSTVTLNYNTLFLILIILIIVNVIVIFSMQKSVTGGYSYHW